MSVIVIFGSGHCFVVTLLFLNQSLNTPATSNSLRLLCVDIFYAIKNAAALASLTFYCLVMVLDCMYATYLGPSDSIADFCNEGGYRSAYFIILKAQLQVPVSGNYGVTKCLSSTFTRLWDLRRQPGTVDTSSLPLLASQATAPRLRLPSTFPLRLHRSRSLPLQRRDFSVERLCCRFTSSPPSQHLRWSPLSDDPFKYPRPI